MSLFRRFEKRTYSGGPLTTPFGPPYYTIPTNGQAGIINGSGGYPMSSDQAMRHWAVYSCTRIIADAVSSFPADAYIGDIGMHLGSATRVTPKPTLLTKPSAYLTYVQWSHQVMMAILLQGNAYGLIADVDRLGYPTQIDLIDPQHVTVRTSDGTAVNSVTGRRIPDGTKTFKIRDKTLTSSEVWHCPGPMMPGELAGLSPVKYAARTIGLGVESEAFGLDFFRNGIHPTAVASSDQPISEEQATIIKSRIKNAAASRDVPVLGAGLKLAPWSVTPEDSDLLEVQRLNAVMVAQIFGVPSEMIGASTRGSTITYANREERAQDFLNNTINPWLTRLEDSFTQLFPRTTFVKFDTKSLLKSDLKTRFESWQIGITAGFMTTDEAREFEDWPEMPEQDDAPETVDDPAADVLPMRPAAINP